MVAEAVVREEKEEGGHGREEGRGCLFGWGRTGTTNKVKGRGE